MPLKAIFDLCRVSNLPTVWTNVLAAVVLSGVPFSWLNFIILSASLSLFYSGGMCLNDLCDIQYDRTQRPSRPLPSNRVSMKSAGLFTAILFTAGILLLLGSPYQEAVWSGLLLLIFIVIYDWIHKKSSLSVFLMAACRLMVFVIAGIAVSGNLVPPVIFAGTAQFVYVLILTLVSRHENRLRRKRSFPLVPRLLAGISLLDGIILAILIHPLWILAGIAGSVLTHLGQRYVRGD
jgi:4-hydroxybenzoate polyprenyltransferase